MIRHPSSLLAHIACSLQASTVCSRHTPFAHGSSHYSNTIPLGYALHSLIFPTCCTPRRFVEKVASLVDLFLVHITRCVKMVKCFFHSLLSNLWWNLVPTDRLQFGKQMAWWTPCNQQGFILLNQFEKLLNVRCLVQVPILTICLCFAQVHSKTWSQLVLLCQCCEPLW